MKRLTLALFVAMLGMAFLVPSARAAFGVEVFDLDFSEADESPVTEAGAHPFSVTNLIRFNKSVTPQWGELPDEALRNVEVQLPPGLVGKPGATPRCSSADFAEIANSTALPKCADSTAVGVAIIKANFSSGPSAPGEIVYISSPIFNLESPKGTVLKLGITPVSVPVTIQFSLSEKAPYNVIASLKDVNQTLPIISSRLILWGNPASPAHDLERGKCVNPGGSKPTEELFLTGNSCPSDADEEPLITMPTKCDSPEVSYAMSSWQGGTAASTVPLDAVTDCETLEFDPTVSPVPTNKAASSSTGLDFSLDIDDPGLTDPTKRAKSGIKKVEVSLPDGLTVNPSVAQGLAACSRDDLARETSDAAPGAGCPLASKIGDVEVETPLLDEMLTGSLYVAKPIDNEFGTLLGTYMVIKSPNLGILVKQAIRIDQNEATGQLTAIADDVPQLPFSHFRLHFRGGERAPLTTPASCGSYDVVARMTPWSGGPVVTDTKAFQITTGAGGGPCPAANRPITAGFNAGTVQSTANAYSPFTLNLTRAAGSPELSTIDTYLPPGLIAKLAGVTECSDGALAAAAARSGANQGALELASPSCPASSQVGTVNVGAGSGSLTYVSGRAYLAGPYKGAPLSLAVITPAVTGPFDLGVVVSRVALYVDLLTAQVHAVSDPLPTILHGIPLEVRSIALNMDRSQFTRNPTSCEPKLLTGSATSVFGTVTSFSQYFQASDCGKLKFEPSLAISLKGTTRRSGHPALKAVLTFPKKGSFANSARIQVGLPHSAFLDQGNIKTVCIQAQLKSATCPPKSIYGHVKAWSPLFDKPLEGPVYLGVGFGHKLPDLVADLNGQVRVLVNGRVDTTNEGGIRNTFEMVPDAPVSKVILEMKGGPKKGLLENSENICLREQRATARLVAQNGRVAELRPVIKNSCKKGK